METLKEQYTTLFPGFIIAATVGFAASFLGEHYGAPAMLFALLLGMALGFVYEDGKSKPGVDFAASKLLRLGVALLGLRIAFADVLAVGWQTVTLIVVGVATTILFGIGVARFFGLKGRFGALTGGAVAICGASAALAISAVLPGHKDHERDTVFAVIGVTSLSTLAMIFYPIISAALGLNDAEAGIFIGATIHDVAQVIGAGYSISEQAGDLATVTKLMRVALLLPVVLTFVLAFRSHPDAAQGKRPPLLPLFLVGFVICVVINSLVTLPEVVTSGLTTFSRLCLITAIAAIGLKTNLRKLAGVGFRPVLLMVAETVWLAALILICLPFVA
ncbi:MAG: YeiH family putative sulfate export transporter [Alphaproteobacteria bacterium]|nr:MAG: YeiH family putative sulfate export transporter [Alphaproteobacteria bacterium]